MKISYSFTSDLLQAWRGGFPAQFGESDAGSAQSHQRIFGEHVGAMRQNHTRRMAEQNWQSLCLLFLGQMNDDFHGKPYAFARLLQSCFLVAEFDGIVLVLEFWAGCENENEDELICG